MRQPDLRRTVLGMTAAIVLGCMGQAHAAGCTSNLGGASPAIQFNNPLDTPKALSALTGQSPHTAPVAAMNALVAQALSTSPGMQSARRSATASEYDLDEQKGFSRPQVGLNGSLTSTYSRVNGIAQPNPKLGAVQIGVSAPLYDGGRLASLDAWRESLRDASRASESESKESVATEVVMLTLERERYELQTRVYQRYQEQMSCLLTSLERIVKEDRGRASELIQARKSLTQAQITVDDIKSKVRQIEVQLTRLLGPSGLAAHGLSGALVDPPTFTTVEEFLGQSLVLKQLRAEAESQKRMAESLRLAYRPSLNWSVIGSSGRSPDGSTSSTAALQAGVVFNATLYSGGTADAGYKAALARADAAQFRLEQVRTEQTARVGELRDQIDQAWSRARQYTQVLKDTDEVRRNTQDLWFLLGRRSLFDVMAAEGDHYAVQVAFVNSVFDGLEGQAQLRSVAGGLADWLAAGAKPHGE